MISSYREFVDLANPYLQICSNFITRHQLVGIIDIDHICFKCNSAEEYDKMRSFLEHEATTQYFYQKTLSGRRVGYSKFYIPISVGFYHRIGYVELADRKSKEEEILGFHHIEIWPYRGTVEDLCDRIREGGEKVVLKRRPHHTTYDITLLPSRFIIRITDEPLIEKIRREQL